MPEELATWTDVAGKAFDDAKRLFMEGEYAGALERHLWFHEHALEFKSSYGGVRLSYALSHWKKLADVYPPALTALVAIRDRDSQRLVAGTGSPQLLHDVASINDVLKQFEATLNLFTQLETAHPELARQSFGYIDRLALRHDPALFRRHCTDPVGFYRQQRESYLRIAVFMQERGRNDREALLRSRDELRELASRVIDVFAEDSEAASKIARLDSATDDELARRLE